MVRVPTDREPTHPGAVRARVLYEAAEAGSTVSGGMGGGRVTDEIWVHGDLKNLGLEEKIKAVMCGNRKRLSK